MNIGQRLDSYLRNERLTQELLSKETEVSRQTINNIIKGKSAPSGAVLAKLKTHLIDLDLNWLLTGVGSMIVENSTHNSSEKNGLNQTEVSKQALMEISNLKLLIVEKDKTIDALKETVLTQKKLINKLLEQINQ